MGFWDEQRVPGLSYPGDSTYIGDSLGLGHYTVDQDPIKVHLENIPHTSLAHVDLGNYHRLALLVLATNIVPGYYVHIPDRLKHDFALDVFEMMDWVPAILTDLKALNRMDPDFDLYFAPSYPQDQAEDLGGIESIDTPNPKTRQIIVWELAKRDNASNGPQPFVGPKPRKARLRESFYIPQDFINIFHRYANAYPEEIETFKRINQTEIIDPRAIIDPSKHYGNYFMFYVMRYDNLIRFDCFGHTKYESQQLARWFYNVLVAETGRFQRMGAQKWVPFSWVTAPDELPRRTEYNFPYSSFYFYARTEQYFIDTVSAISEVELEVYPTPLLWIGGKAYFSFGRGAR